MILVTGANGYIGSALCRLLIANHYAVRGSVRNLNSIAMDSKIEYKQIHSLSNVTDWSEALKGVSCIIHCAGKVDILKNNQDNALGGFQNINVSGTRRLAQQAASAGVRRLIFLSTIKVNGDKTVANKPFSPRDNVHPGDAYAFSKWEAEQALWEISVKTGLEIVIVRPPLVYGPGVKGNLARLLRILAIGLPLPFGAVKNKRSMIGLDNLVDMLRCCIDHPAAAGQTFLISDGKDLSTPELLFLMSKAIGRSARIFPIPIWIIRFIGLVIGRNSEINRLIESLQVDSSEAFRILDWAPQVKISEGIRKMVNKNDTII